MVPTREDYFIKLFLSAYEDRSWADAVLKKPDAIDRKNPAVDQLATRNSDGRTLAVEHTIIEPFVGEKEDFASFACTILKIEQDTTLAIPGRWLEVFVPVGTLQNQSPRAREVISQSLHARIKAIRMALAEGWSAPTCPVTGILGSPAFDITLNVRVTSLKRGSADEPGVLHVRRQQVDNNLDQVIEKALRKKLPKLVNTKADKRILLLERQHMNLLPQSILQEIEHRRTSFSDLTRVDEMWIVETIFYNTAFGGNYLRFELYEKGRIVQNFDFNDGKLM